MKIYGLRIKDSNELLSLEADSNEGLDDCGSCSFRLVADDGKCPWTTTDLDLAVFVSQVSTPWYNSDVETPEHEYEGPLEIVDLSTDTIIADFISVPTLKEYLDVVEKRILSPFIINQDTLIDSFWQYKKYLEVIRI